MHHTYLNVQVERQIETFRYDSHPMGILIATLASLSTTHPEANPALAGDALYTSGPRPSVAPLYHAHIPGASFTILPTLLQIRTFVRNVQIYRILGKLPTIGANAYRHLNGRGFNHPMPESLEYCGNFLYMVDKLNEKDYKPDPVLVKMMDKMFILLAEHGTSCSTITMRHLASSGVDPYSALSGACGTLFGERKASAVISMLTEQVKSTENIPAFLEAIKNKRHSANADSTKRKGRNAKVNFVSGKDIKIRDAPIRLMGFGHRIYKGHDPRVKIVKDLAIELYAYLYKHAPSPDQPSSHLIYLALKLEEAALNDSYFSTRGLYPNIDYWTAIVFYTLGFPPEMFPVLISIARAPGYLAHWIESIDDKEYKIYRPRQVNFFSAPKL